MKRRAYWWQTEEPEIPARVWFERMRQQVAATKSYLERKKELTIQQRKPTVKLT